MGIRSIIFRGKRLDNGEWVEGFYLYTNENTQPVIIDMECCSNVIIPETIGQYTGLVDKNGVKIFEGDIIWLNRRYYKVIYDTLFYAGFCARDLDGDIVINHVNPKIVKFFKENPEYVAVLSKFLGNLNKYE